MNGTDPGSIAAHYDAGLFDDPPDWVTEPPVEAYWDELMLEQWQDRIAEELTKEEEQ